MDKKAALANLQGKKIALLGLGLENQALLAWLKKHRVKAEITIKDARQDPRGFNRGLEKFDLLFRSPGWPLSCPGIKEALRKKKTTLSSPFNLFFALCPTKNIIGVTGTKGKGTTATLIAKIIKDAGRRVWLGGNIGIPPFSFLDRIRPDDYVVLELSSFQLEDLEASPRIAVITNLYREHLAPADPHNPNFHASLKSYWRAKFNIARHPENRYLVANESLAAKITREISGNKTYHGQITYFSASKAPSKLSGSYNQENVGAALSVASLLRLPKGSALKTVANFKNLEHRLQFVVESKGVRYFDNSFSTTPESSVLDLASFDCPIILIAGGADKGADFSSFARKIKEKAKSLILLPGEGSQRLKKELQRISFPQKKLIMINDMASAVAQARRLAENGDVVLLSTGCASFGIFRNYKERGDLFQKYSRMN